MVSSSVQAYLSRLFGQELSAPDFFATGGGCINDTFQIKLFKGKSVFCKINNATNLPHLFEKERNGLELIGKQQIIAVPEVIDCTTVDAQQLLVLEWIPTSERRATFWESFGEKLARLHRVSQENFGWEENNYMGSVPQCNTPEKSWLIFFEEHRLRPVTEKCIQKGLITQKHQEKLEKLYEKLPQIFDDEKPALLHGDLWNGNFMCNEKSEPVLIDPAVYFGHRSADMAMTTLFGGFDTRFYQAYQYHFPLPPHYKLQWAACNLYPLLIHILLFGSSYLRQFEETLKALT